MAIFSQKSCMASATVYAVIHAAVTTLVHAHVGGSHLRSSSQSHPEQYEQKQRRLLNDVVFEYTSGPIAMANDDGQGGQTIVFESNTGEEATMLSQDAYSGDIDLAPADDIFLNAARLNCNC